MRLNPIPEKLSMSPPPGCLVQSLLLPDTQASFSRDRLGLIERRDFAVSPVDSGIPAPDHPEVDVFSIVQDLGNLPAVAVDIMNTHLHAVISAEEASQGRA